MTTPSNDQQQAAEPGPAHEHPRPQDATPEDRAPEHVASEPEQAVQDVANADPAAGGGAANGHAAVVAVVGELRRELARSVGMLEQALTRSQVQAEELYTENQELQLAARKRLQDPLLRELVMLADNCRRTAQDWGKKEQAGPADVEQALVGVAEDIGHALERQGVETFRPEPGARYDRRESRPVRLIETTELAHDSCIAEILRPGYRIEDHVVRPAEVVVWKHVGTGGAEQGASSP